MNYFHARTTKPRKRSKVISQPSTIKESHSDTTMCLSQTTKPAAPDLPMDAVNAKPLNVGLDAPVTPTTSNRRFRTSSKQQTKPSHRSGLLGMLRRPNWSLGLGLVRRNRIQDPELRKSVLPRRPASLDLPSKTTTNTKETSTKTNGGMKNSSHSLHSGSDHSTHNEKWSSSSTLGGPNKKTIKIVEEVLTSKPNELSESEKWKNLDDLVEMAYKIRVSYEFDWEKLLEEGNEEEECSSDSKTEFSSTPLPSSSQHGQQRQDKQSHRRLERPSIHLHKWRDEAPLGGPGVLIR